MTVADVLDAAADLIEPEGAWCQKALGFDALGCSVGAADDIERAVCFCAAGAIWRVVGHHSSRVQAVFEQLNKATGGTGGVGHWNDARKRTQAEVVAKLREAAALARGAA